MINLLPDETKQQIRAAHANTVLAKCLIFALFSAIFVGIACLSAKYLVESTQLTDDKDSGETSQTEKNYSSIIESIINKQVSYSSVIASIANALPQGVTVESISINKSTFESSITFKAHAENTVSESDIKNGGGFISSSIFSNYQASDIVKNKDGSSSYSITVNINKGAVQ